jgi:hypothetical protein
MLVGKARSLSGATLYGKLLALFTNVRLGWKRLPRTNTPAYYENSLITDKKVLYYWYLGQSKL